MRVDLHVHTNSFDTSREMTPERLVETARRRGLDGIASTNHDSVESSSAYVAYGKENGFPIFQGVEIATDQGHLLVYGLTDDSWKDGLFPPSGLPSAFDLLERIDRDRVAVFLAHPFFDSFYPTREALLRFLPNVDGVESINGGKPYVNRMLREKMVGVELNGIGGSDAHDPRDVGDAFTELPRPVSNDGELVEVLKAGACRPVMARALHRFFR